MWNLQIVCDNIIKIFSSVEPASSIVLTCICHIPYSLRDFFRNVE